MGDDIADLRNRQDLLEQRVGDLESTVEAEATARAGMDDDLEELKIKRNMLQKVLDTQSDQYKQLQQLTGKVGNVELVLGYVYGSMELFRASVAHGMTQINGRIDGLESGVNGRIDGLGTRIDGLETRIDGLESGVNGRIDGLGTRIDGLETVLADVKGGVDTIIDRLGPRPASEN